MRPSARLLLAVLGLLVGAPVALRLVRRWAPGLLAGRGLAVPPTPLQATVFSPERLLPRLPLEPGMRVLLLGPVRDRLVEAVARRVGKYGKVYVLDSSPQRLRRLTALLRHERVANVEVLTGVADRLDLPDSTFDLVVLAGVLAAVPRRERTLWEIQRVLRPGGHLSLSEALGGPDYVRSATLRDEAAAVGLEWRAQHGSPLAYTVTFRKAA